MRQVSFLAPSLSWSVRCWASRVHLRAGSSPSAWRGVVRIRRLNARLTGCLQCDLLARVLRARWLGLVGRPTQLDGGGWRPRSSGEKVAAESPTKGPLAQPRLKSLMGCPLAARYSNSDPDPDSLMG